MRFLFYDRIDHIEKNSTITGVKTFTLSEEFLRNHFKKKAIVPGVIFIEAMAQLLGWLVVYSHDFKLSSVMSLVQDVSVPLDRRPGFSAKIHAELVSTSQRDSLGRAWITDKGQEIARVDRIIYSHVRHVNAHALKRLFYYYSGIEIGKDA
jgi:3-hydroxyacyl-[acyl-carrier-protein] dehydratase